MKTQIIPVIHVIDIQQVLYNIHICLELGINKIFLIHHGGSNVQLINIAKNVKQLFPELWVGLNLLGVPTAQALAMEELNEFDGLWCDSTINSELAKKVRTFKGLFFGGLAFKYQRDENDYSKEACNEAILSTDVATTSGPGTGKEANDTKIITIRELLGNHPMAIASGVSIENIHKYSGIVDYLLVASSITDELELINKNKLNELIQFNNVQV